jgi:hypothetical protein
MITPHVANLPTQSSPEFLGPIATELAKVIRAANSHDLIYEISKLVWGELGDGRISEPEAAFLSALMEDRRPARRNSGPGQSTLGRIAANLCGRFIPRQRPRSPNRKASRDRRRMLGGSSALPDTMRRNYTEGQRAVLCIIAGEVRDRGVCDLPNDKIAALAGACRTTVQTTMHEARRLLHVRITERPQRGRKSLTNVIEVISLEWRAWISRAHSEARGIGSNSLKMVSATKREVTREQEALNEKWQSLARGRPGAARLSHIATLSASYIGQDDIVARLRRLARVLPGKLQCGERRPESSIAAKVYKGIPKYGGAR